MELPPQLFQPSFLSHTYGHFSQRPTNWYVSQRRRQLLLNLRRGKTGLVGAPWIKPTGSVGKRQNDFEIQVVVARLGVDGSLGTHEYRVLCAR